MKKWSNCFSGLLKGEGLVQIPAADECDTADLDPVRENADVSRLALGLRKGEIGRGNESGGRKASHLLRATHSVVSRAEFLLVATRAAVPPSHILVYGQMQIIFLSFSMQYNVMGGAAG